MSRELRFDFPGLKVGIAEYDEGPTGCTVFHLPPEAPRAPWTSAAARPDDRQLRVDTRGLLRGRLLYGLEAACGVAAELMAMRGYTVGWEDVELVLGAIVYDFGRQENAIYPDAELGRQALRAATEGVFPLGRRALGARSQSGRRSGSKAASSRARAVPSARSARRSSPSSRS